MPGYFSIWPFFAAIGLLLLVAATPLFRAADSVPASGGNRIETLDGLRGFLALCVFFHHVATSHLYLINGVWISPPSRFHFLLGGFGVAMFFMITGYLFYSQLLRAHGRPDWKKLYVGRIFRILPLYWFMLLFVLLGIGIHTGWHRHVGYRALFVEIARWGAGGLFSESSINGSSFSHRVTASVTWTLQYEWFFYLSLVLLAFAVRRRWIGVLLPPLLFGLLVVEGAIAGRPQLDWMSVALLSAGMSVAALRSTRPSLRIQEPFGSVLVLALLVGVFLTAKSIYTPLPVVLLGLAFLMISLGADLFGLLLTQPARRLGNISYGIYLLQGIILTAASSFPSVRAFALASPLGHWTVALGEALALISLATLAHQWIERPGIELGRHLLSRSSVAIFSNRQRKEHQRIGETAAPAEAAD